MINEEYVEIIKKLVSDEINSDEAYNSLKGLYSKNSNKLRYYSTNWLKEELVNEKVKQDIDTLVVFSDDANFINKCTNNIKCNKIIQIISGSKFSKNNNVYEININEYTDYEKLFNELIDNGVTLENIIHYYSNYSFDLMQDELTRKCLSISVFSMLYIVKYLIKNNIKSNIAYFHNTNNNCINPIFASTAALLKSASLESNLIKWKSIAFAMSESYGDEKVFSEIYLQDESEILYKENQRFTRKMNEIELKVGNDNVLKYGQTILITGGFGGIGNVFANYLVKRYRANVILCGRSDLNDDKQSYLNKLNSFKGTVHYEKCDVSKYDDIRRVINIAKDKYGKVDGVIHCAGVLRDSLIKSKTLEDFNLVIEPKIFGSIEILKALEGEKVQFIALCSSISGIKGNIGQSDYSVGNSFMDFLASNSVNLNVANKIISFNWPLWRNGGMILDNNIIENMIKKTGTLPLENREGIEALEVGLNGDNNIVIPVVHDKSNVRNTIKHTSDYKELEEYLISVFHTQLRIPINKIKINEQFNRYGLDSIMSGTIVNELEKKFKNIPTTILFECQTITELKDYLLENNYDEVNSQFGNNNSDENTELKIEEYSKVEVKNKYYKKNFKIKPIENISINKEDKNNNDIAVIGISGRFPKANNLNEFWQNLVQGRNCISEVPAERWDGEKFYDPTKKQVNKSYTKWGGFISDVDKFDSLFFNISPRQAELMDPQERIFIEEAWHSLEDAGYTPDEIKEKTVGVYVGCMYSQYQLYGDLNKLAENSMLPGSNLSAIANRVSYLFNLTGPSMAVDTMCSSALTCIHLACEDIRHGNTDMAIAGGVNLSIHPNKFISLSQAGLISSKDTSRSFGIDGDGYVVGEGVGAVILKSLDAAKNDGDNIYAVIKGSAISHTGTTNGYMVPSPIAQSKVIEKAIEKSKVNPREISYVEAQATGSEMGDPIEVQGLTMGWKKYTQDKEFCPIGSAKSNIGHLESASAMAALSKVILQMKHKELVPSINSEKLNPKINFKDSMFYVQHKNEKWTKPVLYKYGKKQEINRLAAIDAFGAGGSYAHMILEEYVETREEKIKPREYKYIILSAKTKECLDEYVNEFYKWLQLKVIRTDNSYIENIQEEIARLIKIDKSNIDVQEAIGDYISDYNLYENLKIKIKEKFNCTVPSYDIIQELSIEKLSEEFEGNSNNSTYIIDNSLSLEGIEYTLQVGRAHFEERIAFRVKDVNELLNQMSKYIKEGISDFNKLGLNEDEKVFGAIKRWLSGEYINFKDFYEGEFIIKQSLPTYTFEKERHWIEIVEDENKENIKLDTMQAKVKKENTEDSNLDEEEKIIRIISELLKIHEDKLDKNKNLRMYGIDSLNNLRLINLLEENFNIKISVSEFIEVSNVNEIINYVKSKQIKPQIIEENSNSDVFFNNLNRFILENVSAKEVDFKLALEIESAIKDSILLKPKVKNIEIDKNFKNKMYLFLLKELEVGTIKDKQASVIERDLLN